jgi:hypothetical protein
VGAAVFRYGREVPVQAAGVLRVPMSTTADATQAVSGASSPSDLSCQPRGLAVLVWRMWAPFGGVPARPDRFGATMSGPGSPGRPRLGQVASARANSRFKL